MYAAIQQEHVEIEPSDKKEIFMKCNLILLFTFVLVLIAMCPAADASVSWLFEWSHI